MSNTLIDLEQAGIRVEIGDDFAKYRAYRSQQADRSPLYPMFDVTRSYVDHTNGFWVCGFNAGGELVHTQAVRLLDLSGISLSTHLDKHRHKYITPDSTPDPDLTFYSGPEALHTITGQVCYQGDFWLRARGLGGPRSQGTTSLLSRVLLEVMIAAWNPSFVFALVPKQLAAKGAHLRYGYNHCDPGRWLGPDQQVTEEDYLIWMGASDMANMVRRAPQNLQRATGASTVALADEKSNSAAKASV
ncbi:hypothetical protein RLO149_c030080 [Roseobacter litoralis Och 149]|uniref:Uncharacterized protein n=1 Tax=Roseobacter litoralis (strain ATCC 49566 / DSM 6996 / JCM 21268 / NBRC 15278 / OCh 149) TaxID=391595 RepID=F7ZI14_ROSLO|nr:hypothetical protein [Roseobacter litoralis]AEI94964.1 hypothetical protein RLO149_c030080 [Roseobacter litoralis Och 149]